MNIYFLLIFLMLQLYPGNSSKSEGEVPKLGEIIPLDPHCPKVNALARNLLSVWDKKSMNHTTCETILRRIIRGSSQIISGMKCWYEFEICRLGECDDIEKPADLRFQPNECKVCSAKFWAKMWIMESEVIDFHCNTKKSVFLDSLRNAEREEASKSVFSKIGVFRFQFASR